MSGPNVRPDWRDRLRWAVERSGKTQRAIAAEAEVSPRTLSRILNAERANPPFDSVVRIAEAVGVRVGSLVGEPTGIELTQEDKERFLTVFALLDKITDATKDGRPITIIPARLGPAEM